MAPPDPERPRTRRNVIFMVLLMVFVLLGCAGWLGARSDGIRPGMTRADVDARLGPPDGKMVAVGGTPIAETVYVWKRSGIAVEFDGEDRVRGVTRPPSLLENLRNTFGF